jgi:ABC-2 type transport system permease protein
MSRVGPVRLVGTYLRVNALNEMQYRANFFVQLVQSAIAIFTGLFVLSLVFARTTDLHGWTRAELLAVLGVFTAIGGIVRAVVQPNMEQLLTDVQEGTLDHLLTRPADAQLLASVRRFQLWSLTDTVLGTAVVAVAVVQLHRGFDVGSVAVFVGLLVLGTATIYGFWLLLTAAAFWFIRLGELQQLFDGVFRAGAYPITIYPRWLQAGLTYVVPIGIAITVPAQALTHRLDARAVLVAAAVAVAVLALARMVWRRGLRRYGSASS